MKIISALLLLIVVLSWIWIGYSNYRVSGSFYIDFEKVVSAKSEAAAIREARDQIISRRKIKKSDFNRYEV